MYQIDKIVTYGSKVPNEDTETGQGQYFNKYKLIQEEYLRNLGMADNTEQAYPPEKSDNQEKTDESDTYKNWQNA